MSILRLSEPNPGDILTRGPVIQAGICEPIAPQIQSGSTNIQVTPCTALLDTGAGGNMINPSLAASLGLPIHSYTTFSSASANNVPAKVYVLALSFPPPLNVSYDFVQFAEAPFDFPNHALLLGRSILAKWHITFDMGEGKYTICI